MKKYKWLYLWIAAAALIVFAVVMFLNKEFGNNIIFYLTGSLLIIFVIIRFIPLIKTSKNKWAIAMNAIEMFVDLVIGILFIVLTAKLEDMEFLNKVYPFLLGGVVYIRGAVYFSEICFFETKIEISKFFVNLALITIGSVIIARFDNFDVDSIRILIAFIFAICGILSTVDGIINYNNYRKLYLKDKKAKSDNAIINNQDDIIISDIQNDKQQDYVN